MVDQLVARQRPRGKKVISLFRGARAKRIEVMNNDSQYIYFYILKKVYLANGKV